MPDSGKLPDDVRKDLDQRRNGRVGKRGGYSGSLEASAVPPPERVPSGSFRRQDASDAGGDGR
jgi:hypothetical protein